MNADLPVKREFVGCPAISFRHVYLWLAGIILVSLSPLLDAIELPTLYTAEVMLDPEEEDPRADAYARGLWEIVVRVTGTEMPADAPLIQELFPNPARFVLQFRQVSEETLSISFDGDAVENVLRNAGETVWGADRPLTLVWLAVDWGQGQREIIAADDPDRVASAGRSIDRNRLLRERVRETATRRGVPIVFPLLDTEDLQNVSFADIWGGFDEQLLLASRRYQANSILVGRVRPDALHRNRWTYYFGEIQQEWGGAPEDAVNLLADALAAEFAFSGSAPLETVALNIAGIDSVTAYGEVQHFLDNLSMIDEFEIKSVKGDEVNYLVRLRGGPARLSRALEISDMLTRVDDSDAPLSIDPLRETATLHFLYQSPSRNIQ